MVFDKGVNRNGICDEQAVIFSNFTTVHFYSYQLIAVIGSKGTGNTLHTVVTAFCHHSTYISGG